MQRFALLAAAAILAVPTAAGAATPSKDPVLDVFRNICAAHAGDYAATLKAADTSGWVDAQVTVPPAPAITVTSQAARSLDLNGANLTLLVSSGLQHMKSGDQPEITCRIESDKPDAAAISETQAWLGFKPEDGSDSSLAFFFATGAPDQLVHNTSQTIPPGGLSLIKVQQDDSSAILIDQFFVGKP